MVQPRLLWILRFTAVMLKPLGWTCCFMSPWIHNSLFMTERNKFARCWTTNNTFIQSTLQRVGQRHFDRWSFRWNCQPCDSWTSCSELFQKVSGCLRSRLRSISDGARWQRHGTVFTTEASLMERVGSVTGRCFTTEASLMELVGHVVVQCFMTEASLGFDTVSPTDSRILMQP